jgi:hypothetical protein
MDPNLYTFYQCTVAIKEPTKPKDDTIILACKPFSTRVNPDPKLVSRVTTLEKQYRALREELIYLGVYDRFGLPLDERRE